jgi:hypothetical protein
MITADLPVITVYIVGRERPATAMSNIVEATPAESLLNVCSRYLNPPKSMLKPMSKRIFKIIEPIIDAFTISTSPAWIANIAIINSIALPNVAFNKLPTIVLVLNDSCWVDLAIRLVSGMIAKIAAIKTAIGIKRARYSQIEIGMKT